MPNLEVQHQNGTHKEEYEHTKSVQCNIVPVFFGKCELLIQLKINCVVCTHLQEREKTITNIRISNKHNFQSYRMGWLATQISISGYLDILILLYVPSLDSQLTG